MKGTADLLGTYVTLFVNHGTQMIQFLTRGTPTRTSSMDKR